METEILKLLARLLPILIQVESGGDPNAVGDGGRAIGILQIHKAYWTDGTDRLKVDWPYEDAVLPKRAQAVTAAYLIRYGEHYERLTGKAPTLEILARIHNGGPYDKKYPQEWFKKTDPYWNKVRKALK